MVQPNTDRTEKTGEIPKIGSRSIESARHPSLAKPPLRYVAGSRQPVMLGESDAAGGSF